MIDHERQSAPVRLVNQAGHELGTRRKGLLDQHMLTGSQCCHRQLIVRMHRRSDGDCIDAAVLQQIFVASGRFHRRVKLLHRAEPARAQVADADDTSGRIDREIANEIGAPITVTHNADSQLTISHADLDAIQRERFQLSCRRRSPHAVHQVRAGMSCHMPRVSMTSRCRRSERGTILNSSWSTRRIAISQLRRASSMLTNATR